MGKRPLVTLVALSLVTSFTFYNYMLSILTQAVSPDATIAIVFGLIGVILSLAGVLIACLTLRFMILEKCMLPLSFPFFSLQAIV